MRLSVLAAKEGVIPLPLSLGVPGRALAERALAFVFSGAAVFQVDVACQVMFIARRGGDWPACRYVSESTTLEKACVRSAWQWLSGFWPACPGNQKQHSSLLQRNSSVLGRVLDRHLTHGGGVNAGPWRRCRGVVIRRFASFGGTAQPFRGGICRRDNDGIWFCIETLRSARVRRTGFRPQPCQWRRYRYRPGGGFYVHPGYVLAFQAGLMASTKGASRFLPVSGSGESCLYGQIRRHER